MFVLTPLKITAKDYCATKGSYWYQRKGASSKKLKLKKKTTKKHLLKIDSNQCAYSIIIIYFQGRNFSGDF